MNALGRDAWFALARKLEELGRDARVRDLVIDAAGKGCQCGVDVKELARDGSIIVDVNRGCHEVFAAIYDCPVPVISAVHGFCLGGGIGMAGASDIVLAADDASFGLPEIDRGALGAATHLMRLFGPERDPLRLLVGRGQQRQPFAGLNGDTVPYNVTLALAMLLGRFMMIVPVLALAGSLAKKKVLPPSEAAFPASGATFVVILIGTVLVVGALTFLPALALGPVVEHFLMTGSGILY